MATKTATTQYNAANYPLWLKDIIAWMNNPNIPMYGRWSHAAQNEGGVDITSPAGTPVYALASGTLEGAGNFWHSTNLYTPGSGPPGYGVVTERVNVPGYGTNDLYYQHIKLASGIQTCYADQCNGQLIQQGQLLGWVEPGVNEVEVGFNADWGGVWGTNHPNPWVTDPRPMIQALLLDKSGQQQGQSGSSSSCDPNQPVVGYFCNANNQLQIDIGGIQNWLVQAGIVIFGALLVFGALMLVFKEQ